MKHNPAAQSAVSPTTSSVLTWQRWLVPAWLISVVLVLFWLFNGWGFDDPFITYRYARNLATGQGFVYNPGERMLSTTAPLYALLLAPVALAGLDVPQVSVLIGCLALALGGLAFWRLGQVWGQPPVGLVGLLAYPLFPLLLPTLGAETAVVIALVLFGVLAYTQGHDTRAAVLLALAALTRADSMLVALLLGVHTLVWRRQLPAWRALLLYATLLVLGFGLLWIYFGSPLPITLAAKQRQGLLAVSTSFAAGLLSRAGSYWADPWWRAIYLLVPLGLLYGLLRRSAWLLIVAWSTLYALAYTLLGVTGYFWYYGPVIPGVLVLAGLGAAAVVAGVGRVAGQRWPTLISAALVVLPIWLALLRTPAQHDPRQAIYQAAGTWLRASTPATTSVGTLEVGIIGYYSERRMIDFAGLLQPETARQLGRTTTYQDAALWAIGHFKPEYLVLYEGFFPSVEQQARQAGCHPAARFVDQQVAQPLVIYDCR